MQRIGPKPEWIWRKADASICGDGAFVGRPFAGAALQVHPEIGSNACSPVMGCSYARRSAPMPVRQRPIVVRRNFGVEPADVGEFVRRDPVLLAGEISRHGDHRRPVLPIVEGREMEGCSPVLRFICARRSAPMPFRQKQIAAAADLWGRTSRCRRACPARSGMARR